MLVTMTQGKDKDTKKLPAVGQWLANLTPEERKQHYANLSATMKKHWEDKREQKNKAIEIANSLVPQVMAQKIAEDLGASSRPDPNLIMKFREVVGTGEPLEKIRVKYFKAINDDQWNNFKKYLFAEKVSQVEDLGNMLLSAQEKHRAILSRRKRELRREINQWKKSRRGDSKYSAPISLLNMLYETENKLLELDMDVPKALSTVDAVGNKKGAPSVTIVTNVPAPGEKPVVKSIKTVEKMSVSEAMAKLGVTGGDPA